MEPEADIFPVASAMATHTGNLSCQLRELSDHVVLCRNFCESGASTSTGNPFVVVCRPFSHCRVYSVIQLCICSV